MTDWEEYEQFKSGIKASTPEEYESRIKSILEVVEDGMEEHN